MTKAAQIHLVKGLALAAGPRIRVNSVSPGLMLTVCYTIRHPSPSPSLLPSYPTLSLPPPLSISCDYIHITARHIREKTGTDMLTAYPPFRVYRNGAYSSRKRNNRPPGTGRRSSASPRSTTWPTRCCASPGAGASPALTPSLTGGSVFERERVCV